METTHRWPAYIHLDSSNIPTRKYSGRYAISFPISQIAAIGVDEVTLVSGSSIPLYPGECVLIQKAIDENAKVYNCTKLPP